MKSLQRHPKLHRMAFAPFGASAFTLIELLTVIAIIGILAAIVIPTVGKVRMSARTVQCISNLRQIGIAMALATEDRKGVLPGPFMSGQGRPDTADPTMYTYRAYTEEDIANDYTKGQVFGPRLGPYMGMPATGQNRKTKLFVCPAFGLSGYTGPSYHIAKRIDKTKGSGTDYTSEYSADIDRPFGHPGSSPNSTLAPKSLGTITEFSIPASRLWAVADCNSELPGSVPAPADKGPGWGSEIPQRPIHGTHANALFFDWHVGKLNASGPVR